MTQAYTPDTEKVKQAYSGLHEKNYYDFDMTQREENFDRWLAAHDAQIRAEEHVKALELTDYELEMLEDARTSSDEWGFGKDIEALKIGIEAVADHRKEQK